MAEILRGAYDIVSDSAGWHWLNGTLFGMSIVARSEDCIRNGLEELSDLIDPGDAQSRDGAKTVDRDALLALADEMDRVRNRCDFCGKERDCDWADETICLEDRIDDYANIIREACGEVGPCDGQS